MTDQQQREYGPKTKAALESLQRSKEALSQAALDGESAERLGQIVREIARGEGYLQVQAVLDEATTYLKDNEDEANTAIRRTLLDGLLRGADDTWSGRGNDIKREIFDGYRSAAQRALRGF